MEHRAPYVGVRLVTHYTALALPAVGLLLLLVSWLIPQVGIPRSIGVAVFLCGWLLWSIVSAAALDAPYAASRLRKFVFALVFFPVLYPLTVILAPYAERLRKDVIRLRSDSPESVA